MRASLRLLNLEVSSLQGSRTRYVCSVCRHEALPRPLIARQFLRNASSDNAPLTERVRRKLWGTENPPGLKDPYGGEGVLERKFKKTQAEGQDETVAETTQVSEAEYEAAEDAAVGDAYEPAATWEGIPHIGHLGRWTDLPPSEADSYDSFMLKKKLTKKHHLHLAAHQAAVEICLLHSLNKPLTSACKVLDHDKSVYDLIRKCEIEPKEAGELKEALVYPDQETQNALEYIFEQIGGQTEAAAVGQESLEADETTTAPEVDEGVSQGSGLRTPDSPFFDFGHLRQKGFLGLPLNDPMTKFAFLKRFSQLSGHYFPDPAVHSISSIKQALQHIQTALNPKPKKLAEHLASSNRLQNLPNVKVFAKRQKRSDRDEELGRKKVIAQELRERGLI
ncbi:hypothetical protein P170DRAFT_431892 [Aspergillus steynii IBT 23096]|uniref:Large ribosomal subunit protein mL50 n=1 Tax=Aspergillus steynii IBT 23096 TaxID=1392250 RepID=A0A2I2GN13_9EURO|nr:uncharacterized protein P170DRAFT_431892 [Aspergillus steynii IBT 23096]PLB54264.1 hypothetical protein P170DRAFT_431892 [Aspergillus steynii IBT 23096]